MANEILAPAKRLVYWDNLPAGWTDDNMAADAVAAALARFGQDVTRTVVSSITGDGTNRSWDLSGETLDGWDERDSELLDVAWPWSATDENWLDGEAWTVVDSPTTGKALVMDSTPAQDDVVAIRFTALWEEGTVPAKWRPCVAKLAAAHMARAFAGRRAATGDSSISAAVSVGPNEVQTWLQLARDLEKAYASEVTSSGGDGSGGVDAGLVIGQTEPWYDDAPVMYRDD